MRLSNLYKGNPYTGMTASLFWNTVIKISTKHKFAYMLNFWVEHRTLKQDDLPFEWPYFQLE